MRTQKQRIGTLGEDIACRFLKNKGFSIKGRNYRKKWGEIDIIAGKNNTIRFVEVKTVSREKLPQNMAKETGFRPEDNVHPGKIKRLHRAIQTYLADQYKGKNIDDVDWGLDVVTVELNTQTKEAKINFIENIS